MNTTLTTVLYTSKTLSDGTHPLMLRLTKNRRIKYISLHISLDAKFWDFDKSRPKRNCPDKERINTLIETKTKELQEQILDFKTSDKEYTLNTLLEKASRKVVRQTVGDYLNDYIDRLLAAKQGRQCKDLSGTPHLADEILPFAGLLFHRHRRRVAETVRTMAAGGTALFRQLHRHPFPFVAGTLQQRNHRRPNQENGLPFRHVQSEPIQGSHGQTVADKGRYSADYGLRGADADQVPQTVPATCQRTCSCSATCHAASI